ncbi:MAG: DNA-binding protein [Archaeoglobales archaeon]|nr:MAG: DNA-binding protein [Archaeoglobales archaeon]
MPERSQDWMRQAKRDFEMAKEAMNDGFYEWSCFAAQQAAEKAVKAVFQKMGSVAWGHSVFDLLRALSAKISVPDDVLNCARALDRYYIPTRYPNGFDSGSPFEYFTEEDARNAILYCRRVIEFCESVLAEER